MKNKGLIDVEDGIDRVQKLDLDSEGLLRHAPIGCGLLEVARHGSNSEEGGW